jgi:hypothetical protein
VSFRSGQADCRTPAALAISADSAGRNDLLKVAIETMLGFIDLAADFTRRPELPAGVFSAPL